MDLDGIITEAQRLFYLGRHSSALTLLQDGINQIQTSASKSQQLEIISLEFAVHSIYYHHLDADQTINLLRDKLQSPSLDPSSSHYFDLVDLLGLATYYKQLSQPHPDFSGAGSLFFKSLEYRKSTSDSSLAQSYLHVGLLEQSRNNLDSAKTHLVQALEVADPDNISLHSSIQYHLGKLFLQMSKPAQARMYCERSLERRLDHNLLITLPFSCIALADCFVQLDTPDRTVHLYEKAVEIAESIHLDLGLATAHYSLARYYHSSDPSLALDHYLTTYSHARSINHEKLIYLTKTQLQLK